MVYDEVIISLFKDSPLPKMFVFITKREDKVFVCVKQNKFLKGVLFLYANSKYFLLNIYKPDNMFLLGDIKLKSSFVCAFYSGAEVFIGKKGDEQNEEEILRKFSEKYSQIKKQEKEAEKKKFDLNFITDNICLKLFNSLPLSFFGRIKNQFERLLNQEKRDFELETAIPNSRFVQVLNNENALVGVVFKNNAPILLALGYKGNVEKLQNEGEYQYIRCGKNGYFLVFRRASDGDRCFFD